MPKLVIRREPPKKPSTPAPVPKKATVEDTGQWKEQAKSIAERWAAPRSGGFPPSCTLEYIAEAAYWQAQNLGGFQGSLEDWCEVVSSYLPTT